MDHSSLVANLVARQVETVILTARSSTTTDHSTATSQKLPTLSSKTTTTPSSKLITTRKPTLGTTYNIDPSMTGAAFLVTEPASTSSGRIVYKTRTIYETQTGLPSSTAVTSHERHLSSGHIAGVVGAIVVLLLALVGMGLLYLRRRRRRQREEQFQTIEDIAPGEVISCHEKDGASILELHHDPVSLETSGEALHEMAAHVELEGDRPEPP